MKKVIIAFDGDHFSEGAFRFLLDLNSNGPILATGVFLPRVDYMELLYSFGGISGPVYYKDFAIEDTASVEQNIARFKKRCEQNDIEYRVHPNMDAHIISNLRLETRFADLMLISSELFYKNLGEDSHEEYMTDALQKTECPIVLVPEQYKSVENAILAYDGSAASVFAIKQFSYLMPQFSGLKTLLVSAGVKQDEETGISNIEEFAARHFSDLIITNLNIDPIKYFNTWLQNNGNSILVAGAFGRSALSEMLRKSFITDAIQDHKMPIFIAHK